MAAEGPPGLKKSGRPGRGCTTTATPLMVCVPFGLNDRGYKAQVRNLLRTDTSPSAVASAWPVGGGGRGGKARVVLPTGRAAPAPPALRRDARPRPLPRALLSLTDEYNRSRPEGGRRTEPNLPPHFAAPQVLADASVDGTGSRPARLRRRLQRPVPDRCGGRADESAVARRYRGVSLAVARSRAACRKNPGRGAGQLISSGAVSLVVAPAWPLPRFDARRRFGFRRPPRPSGRGRSAGPASLSGCR